MSFQFLNHKHRYVHMIRFFSKQHSCKKVRPHIIILYKMDRITKKGRWQPKNGCGSKLMAKILIKGAALI